MGTRVVNGSAPQPGVLKKAPTRAGSAMGYAAPDMLVGLAGLAIRDRYRGQIQIPPFLEELAQLGLGEEVHRLAEPGPRSPDGFAGRVDRRDRKTGFGPPGSVVAGSASQLEDAARARLPQRHQERPGPPALPVEIIARLPPLAEEPVPELGACMGHAATVRRAFTPVGSRSLPEDVGGRR